MLSANLGGLSLQQVGSYSFVFPSAPGDESWPALRGRPVRFLMPLLDLLNHAPDPNVAIQRSPDGAERAFSATALRHIRWDDLHKTWFRIGKMLIEYPVHGAAPLPPAAMRVCMRVKLRQGCGE